MMDTEQKNSFSSRWEYPKNMTETSRKVYDMVISGDYSIKQAVELLKENAYVRTTRETILKYAGKHYEEKGDAFRQWLVEALTEQIGYTNQQEYETVRDAQRKNVQRWLKKTNTAIEKESAIPLCYVLRDDLGSLEEINAMLCDLCQECFHWRNPEDIVYIYGLQQNLSYKEAFALYIRISEKAKGKTVASPKQEQKRIQAVRTKNQISDEGLVYTNQVREQVIYLKNEEELERYMIDNWNDLGELHRTAGKMFRGYYDLLRFPPVETLEKEKEYRTADILQNYLYLSLVPSARNPKMKDALQRCIRRNWPTQSLISRMYNGRSDVSRKALMLMFLATSGDMKIGEKYVINSLDDNAAYDDEEDYEELSLTPEQNLENLKSQMDQMLMKCGFAVLDPRVQFDWMVMFCMRADDELFIDKRIQAFLSEIFNPDSEE